MSTTFFLIGIFLIQIKVAATKKIVLMLYLYKDVLVIGLAGPNGKHSKTIAAVGCE